MATPQQVKRCPSCQHTNPASATRCARCGLELPSDVITINVSDEPPQTVTLAPPQTIPLAEQPPRVHYDTVALHVAGEAQPLLIRDLKEVLLGRQVPGEPAPSVDLSPFHGHALGVSRRHAIIRRNSEGYTIEDLNSVNGTWVNERKLLPGQSVVLRGGDQIRLGQLLLFFYFPSTISPSPANASS